MTDVDSFFAFEKNDDEVGNREDEEKKSESELNLGPMTIDEKKDRIKRIYSKMARLQTFINHTKSEIMKIEKTPEAVNPLQKKSDDNT